MEEIQQQNFPELKKKYWGKHLWVVGYFVRTTGNVTDQMVKDYIENHSKRELVTFKSKISILSQSLDF